MPYYVSIKANNSTVQEFCAVLMLGLYGRVGAFPTYVESVQLQGKKNWEEREVRGRKDEDTSKENLANTGDGERGYWEKT